MRFANRTDAGRRLAARLASYAGSHPLVLAVPRGGVVVGYEVARALAAPLDVIIPRKLGAPFNEELAIGAVTETGEPLLDRSAIARLGVERDYVEREIARQREEIRRRTERYRAGHPAPDPAGRPVIVVDDGVATGFTITAALRAVRARGPSRLVLAVPVAPPETLVRLEREVDHLVCLAAPEPFFAVGQFYEVFDQTTDEEVVHLLAGARRAGAAGNGGPGPGAH